MNMRCTARLKFDAIQVAKIAIYTAFICNFRFRFTHTFLSQKIFMHFLVTKRFCAHFFLSPTRFTVFFAKTIYALRPESFCALKVAIRKVQTFWASAAKDPSILKHKPFLARTAPSNKTPTSLPSTYKVSEMENFKFLMKQRLDTMKQHCEILRIV